MNRRDFLRLSILALASTEIDIDKLLWIPGEKKIFIPSSKQLSLYGIPYYADVAYGEWLGQSRLGYISKELIEMIKILEQDKQASVAK